MKHLYRYCPGVVLSIFMMCVALVGCVPEAIELPCRVRAIVTDSATNISVNEATLNAVVSLIDKDSIDCGVIYGANETLSSAKGTMVATAANGEYAVVVDKLKANTTYYYRAYALDAGMYKYGKVHSFKTDISVATGEATEITDCSAMLGGEVNSSDVQLSCGVIYSTSQENVTSTKDCVMASTTSKGVYAVPVTELKHATTYYYRAYAVMDGAYRYGEVRSFKTTLAVATGEATDVTPTSAKLNGALEGAENRTTCGFYYGTTETLDTESWTKLTTNSDGEFYKDLTDLKANTVYYYCAYAIIGGNYRYGEVCSFKTGVTITTLSASDVTATSATLKGWMNSSEAQLPCGFIYGTSSELTPEVGQRVSTTANGDFTASIANLKDNTTYYYRAYVVVDGEYQYGKVLSFLTGYALTVTTNSASSITHNSVMISGKVTGAGKSVTCGVIYSTESTLSSTSGSRVSTTANGSFTVAITGLNANTTYYYRAYAVSNGVYTYGEISSFKTAANVTVTTGEATNVTGNSVTMNAAVSSSGQLVICGIVYNTTTSLSFEDGVKLSTTSKGAYSFYTANLQPNTTYYYRAYVSIGDTYKYGATRSFKTLDASAMSINKASSITENSATLNGTASGVTQSAICGIICGTSSTLTLTNAAASYIGLGNGNFTWTITDLNPNTTYYYCYYILVDGVYKYGEVSSFTTLQRSIVVNTGEASDITENGATLRGMIEGLTVWAECGFIYGTSNDLSSTNGTKVSDSTQGSYVLTISGLTPNTTYYYRAYAKVNDEYKYGEVRSFTTLQEPAITTGEATDITTDGATLSGVVSNVTEAISCGVIYGTSSDMSSLNNNRKGTSSNGTYSISVSYLQPNTTYYYCAYAIIGGEEKYGEVRSFTTLQVSGGNTSSHEAVDLGLSVKWATCNVGATSPEEYGDYFAWGETATKSSYTKSNSVTYGLSISELESRGIIDANGNLTAAYDAATVNWGSDWRMPTETEIGELCTECDWYWTTMNGVKGYTVQSRTNGNSIFLPAAGYRGDTSLDFAGSYGRYWSATPYSNSSYAYGPNFDSGNYGWYDYPIRYFGRAVRPVYSEAPLQVVTIETGEATDIIPNGVTLSGVVNGTYYHNFDCGIIYDTTSDLSSTSVTALPTSSNGSYSVSTTGLTPNTTYYYCAYVYVNDEFKYGEVRSFTTMQVSGGNTSSHEAVDLGLSVKWASYNVGATSPEEYGDYFAWGETTTKTDYSESNSVTYGLSIEELESRGIIDTNGNLTAAYDAATVNWGGYWRMPTETEINELCTECDWELTAMNGVYGYMVKSRTNDNSIFLPAAGYRHGTSLYFEGSAGSGGFYWSATAKDDDDDESYTLYFYLDYNYGGASNDSRDDGRAVRPVSDK